MQAEGKVVVGKGDSDVAMQLATALGEAEGVGGRRKKRSIAKGEEESGGEDVSVAGEEGEPISEVEAQDESADGVMFARVIHPKARGEGGMSRIAVMSETSRGGLLKLALARAFPGVNLDKWAISDDGIIQSTSSKSAAWKLVGPL